jgi:hypothetical protein
MDMEDNGYKPFKNVWNTESSGLNEPFIPKFPNMTPDELRKAIREIFETTKERPSIYMSKAQYEAFDRAVKAEVAKRYGDNKKDNNMNESKDLIPREPGIGGKPFTLIYPSDEELLIKVRKEELNEHKDKFSEENGYLVSDLHPDVRVKHCYIVEASGKEFNDYEFEVCLGGEWSKVIRTSAFEYGAVVANNTILEYMEDNQNNNNMSKIKDPVSGEFADGNKYAGTALVLVSAAEAMKAVNEYKRIQRYGWNGTGMFVFAQVPSIVGKDIIPKMTSLPQSVKDEFMRRGVESITYSNQLAIVYPDNTIHGWSPSPADFLAEDWIILD